MTSEFANSDNAPEPRDYMRWVWAGIVVLFVVLGTILYFKKDVTPQESTARVRHILIRFDAKDPAERGQALARIRDIRERVLKGEDFGELARNNSNDPGSASRGGDLGHVKKGELAETIDNYIWTAPIGQLSDVIITNFGFHIVVVDERRLSEADEFQARQRAQANEGPAEGSAPAAPPAQP